MLKKTYFVILILVSVVALANAQVPQQFNYQGKITDAGGNAINDTLTIQFKIYQDEVAFLGKSLFGVKHNLAPPPTVFLMSCSVPLTQFLMMFLMVM